MNEPVLELRGIEKGYKLGKPGEVRVLRGADLTIGRGEVVALTLTPNEIGDKKLVWGFTAQVGDRPVAKGALTTVYAWREGQGPMSAALVPLDVKTALQKRFGV